MGAPKVYTRRLDLPVTDEMWARLEFVAALRGKGTQEAARAALDAGLDELLQQITGEEPARATAD